MLSGRFIPPTDMRPLRWFLADQPAARWFYHCPRSPETAPSPRSPTVASTLDPPLRALVHAVWRRGARTGPSCAGHVVSFAHAAAVYAQLCADADKVRGAGLVLRDVETQQRLLWRDPTYRVPYPSVSALYLALKQHELHGVLPVVGPPAVLRPIIDAAWRVPGVCITPLPHGVQLHVQEPTAGAQAHVWAMLAAEV